MADGCSSPEALPGIPSVHYNTIRFETQAGGLWIGFTPTYFSENVLGGVCGSPPVCEPQKHQVL